MTAQNVVCQSEDLSNANTVELITVKSANWHFTTRCNYNCKFCCRQNAKGNLESPELIEEVLEQLKKLGIEKLNLVGGEPLMHKMFFSLVREAYSKGFTVSVTTNGSLIDERSLARMKPYVKWIGISLDSVSDVTAKEMGRGKGAHLKHIREIVPLIHEAGINLKINTTVTRQTKDEDMHELIAELSPARWKVFQFMEIKGQNDTTANEFAITDEEFEAYRKRHEDVILTRKDGSKDTSIFESEECMKCSYLMIDAEGYVEKVTENGVERIPLKDVDLSTLSDVVDYDEYERRRAKYEWK